MSGWRLSCLPHKVYDFLYGFKSHFRCAQGRHFLLFCWLLVALIVDQGKGTLKGLSRHLPPRIRYWALLKMVRSGQWDAQAPALATKGLTHMRYCPGSLFCLENEKQLMSSQTVRYYGHSFVSK